MAFANRKTLAFLTIITLFQVSFAAVYQVGDSAGWTWPIFGVDYNRWASRKTFYVGDVVVFRYSNLFHNVEQVNQENFQSCNATSPIASYSSGNDSITLKTAGHYYFLCGVPGHCQIGQKVEIKVSPKSAARPTTSPVPTPVLNA